MARRTKRPPVTRQVHLRPERRQCSACGGSVWAAYENERTVTTLDAVCRLTLTIARCHTPACPRFCISYRPEEEGAWSLPHHEFGLDVIARIGSLRYREHRSIPEIHQALLNQGVAIAQRTVSDLLARYEELLALRLADRPQLTHQFIEQGHVILAIDGLQPDKSEDVLWVIRDCLSGAVLLARSLDSMRSVDLAELLREVKDALSVPLHVVVSDAQKPIRLAVQEVLPGVPHQLCHFHYLKEAGAPGRSRSPPPIQRPRPTSRSTCGACATLSRVWRGARTPWLRWCGASAWPCAVHSPTTASPRSSCPASCSMTGSRRSRTRSTVCW